MDFYLGFCVCLKILKVMDFYLCFCVFENHEGYGFLSVFVCVCLKILKGMDFYLCFCVCV